MHSSTPDATQCFFAANDLVRNDVPEIDWNQTGRQEIERTVLIGGVVVGHVADIVASKLEGGGLYLDAQKTPGRFHHEVVGRRLTARPAQLQSLLGGAQHEAQLRPFTPALGVLDSCPVFGHEIVPLKVVSNKNAAPEEAARFAFSPV